MSKARWSRWLFWLPFIPALLGLYLLIADPPAQQALRLGLFDQYQRWRPRAYVDAPVRIVDIDEASLAQLGQWPWPRNRLAALVERLNAGGAAAIVFDVMFAEPDRTSPRAMAAWWSLPPGLYEQVVALPDHDEAFAASLARSDSVIGFAAERMAPGAGKPRLPELKARFVFSGTPAAPWLPAFDSAVTSLPLLESAARGNGFLSFVPDGDGVVRRVPLLMQVGGRPVPSLLSEALRVAQGARNVIVKSAGQASGVGEVRIGEAVVPTTANGEMWVHYTPPVTARYVPAWTVLSDAGVAPRLAGRIVLVGSSAQGLQDLRFGPFGLLPGVEVHAQALEQVLGRHFLERPAWARGAEAVLLALGALAVGLLALRATALRAAVASALLIAALFGGGWLAFARHGLLLDVLTPAVATVLSFIICSLAHHLVSEREERWIREAFSRYVSPNRVRHLVEHHEDMALGGRRQECSFVFTDLADFTGLMERMDPGEAVALLNAYLDEMIGIAFRHEGTLDRIVGDAVAIVFSAPVGQLDHRQRALRCALDMDAFAGRYAKSLSERGIAFGKTRIGVHGGEVIVGNFGGKAIFDYRALGDPVNTASRLEGANKYLGTRLCVSAYILDGNPSVEVRPVGRLVFKGKCDSLAVFEPVTDDSAGRAPSSEYRSAFDSLDSEGDAGPRFAALAATYPDDPLVAFHARRLAAGERGDLIVFSEK